MKFFTPLLLILLGFVFINSYSETAQETLSISITRDGDVKVSESFFPKNTISSFKVSVIGQSISNILAYDESNIILKTLYEDGKIRIDSLGSSHVSLSYQTNIVSEDQGLWHVNYESEKISKIILPSSSNLVSVNTIPRDISEEEITMPPGKIILTYTLKYITSHDFQLNDGSIIQIMTSSDIEDFTIEQKGFTIKTNDKNTMLVILPKSFIQPVPQISLNDNLIEFNQYYQNTTHHWIRIEPNDIGSIKIVQFIPMGEPIPVDVSKGETREPTLESDATDTTSESGGCLIATAAFGSELAPQVQQLRETRDNVLLHTTSGTAFMTAFNSVYYTFSPTIAEWEMENPIFKEIVKATITPLITTLLILNYVNIDSETEMLGYGIGIISLNLGIYFVAPTVAIIKIRSFLISHK